MKFYQDLAAIPAFTLLEASEIIGNKTLTPKNLNAMVKERNGRGKPRRREEQDHPFRSL